jgi:hypothetical protein
VKGRAFLAGIAALLAWPKHKPKLLAHVGCCPICPDDYEGRMLLRLQAACPWERQRTGTGQTRHGQ